MPHVVMKNKDGKRVPSVTTVLGVMAKPQLVYWANKIGLEGIKVNEYVDDKAVIGTLAHYMAECDVNGVTPDYQSEVECSDEQIEQAKVCFDKYLEWKSYQDEFEPMFSEIPLVSEEHQYSGTFDLIAKLNGKVTLIDFKTCSSIHYEALIQTVAYKKMIEENNLVDKIEQIVILRIGRDENEGFECYEVREDRWDIYFDVFLTCLKMYQLNKECSKDLKNERN